MYGAISGTMGLVIGLGIALFSMVGAGLAPDGDAPAWLGPVFGVGAIIFLPIFYGVMGLIGGALSAVFYNVFASLVGGVTVDVE
jgi:hypothetical protein